MTCDCSQGVALILDVLNLLQPNDCQKRVNERVIDIGLGYTRNSLSLLRRILSAKTFWPSLGASARHASQTLAKVPNGLH